MKSTFFSIIIIFVICSKGFAQPQQVTTTEASWATITRVSVQTGRKNINVTDIAFCKNDNDNVLLYEVETDAGLTVLISGNKACQPIIGIHSSSEGLLLNKRDSLPDGLKYFLDYYKSQINNSFKGNGTLQTHTYDWDKLMNGEVPYPPKSVVVPPLLHSKWSQRKPNNNVDTDAYNFLIEEGSPCEHCLAGCVAVAMGQVMYYWKYPVIVSTRDTQFNWCHMTDSLNTMASTYIENRNAIAYLLKECGKSVNMHYGCTGSGAASISVPGALIDDFKYKNTAYLEYRAYYDDKTWIKLLKRDLNLGCPIIYTGYASADSGHAFVCDGYNDYDEFHFNWGWGGQYDGPNDFYTINYLNPAGSNFANAEDAILNIRPAKHLNWCDTTLDLTFFYPIHVPHNHPIYTCTPQTATKLISASIISPSTWRTIPINATAEYRAHEEIHLRDGFTVERGAEFTAQIVPCANCENNRGVEDQSIVETDNEQEESVPDMAASRPSIATEGLREETVLYPNPTDGELTIGVDGEVQSIVIYNAMGRPVGGWNLRSITPDHVTLDITTLPRGAYIVRIHTPMGVTSRKLVLK